MEVGNLRPLDCFVLRPRPLLPNDTLNLKCVPISRRSEEGLCCGTLARYSVKYCVNNII